MNIIEFLIDYYLVGSIFIDCIGDDDTNIKVADFGFAKRVVDLKPDETPCGTPE